MKISIFAGDIADAPAEALCTSTNPRLSLVMGTGASIRARGGFSILRECEAIVEEAKVRTGRGELPPGSTHVTSAGTLPARIVVHCVASGAGHRTSADVIRACVAGALARAGAAGCSSIALPLFGTGHASFDLDESARVIAGALLDASAGVGQAWIVALDAGRADEVRLALRKAFPRLDVEVVRSASLEDGATSLWGSDD
jgi:O-acetyl-ADP-ribose deacetylase (regulator of RNase III)